MASELAKSRRLFRTPALPPFLRRFVERIRLGVKLRGWGRGQGPQGTLDEIASYRRGRLSGAGGWIVPEQVWSDLEMDAVVRAVDHCASAVGQQILYDLLRSPLSDPEEVGRRSDLIRCFDENPDLRLKTLDALKGLSGSRAYYLQYLFLSELPRRPRFYLIFPILTLSAFASIALLWAHVLAWVALLSVALTNLGVQAYYRPRVGPLIAPMSELRAMLRAARALERNNEDPMRPYSDRLRAARAPLRWLEHSSGHLAWEVHENEIIQVLVGYANLFFLFDVNAFVFNIERINRHRDSLQELFETIGFLDAMCAVSLWRDGLTEWCTPQFRSRGKELVAKRMYHPLLDGPVSNDLMLSGKGMFVTGSNMAGKSTYLRTTGLCALLAQTIATCPARQWHAPLLRVASLLDREDDLIQGKSYFLVEVELVRELLTASASDVQHLFLIDEIFRGTNRLERIAGSSAALAYLNRREDLCVVATHDLELVDLLGPDWTFGHFSEQTQSAGIRFDYQLRDGTSSAPNAIRLMETSGFPQEVVDTALGLYERLGRRDRAVEED